MGTAVGLSTDLHEGIIDRSTLPMSMAAVLVGRSFADMMTSCICALPVVEPRLAVGWRPDAGVGSVFAGFALVLFFAYSLSWVARLRGPEQQTPESAASFGFIVLFHWPSSPTPWCPRSTCPDGCRPWPTGTPSAR